MAVGGCQLCGLRCVRPLRSAFLEDVNRAFERRRVDDRVRSAYRDRVSLNYDAVSKVVTRDSIGCGEFRGLCHIGPAVGGLNENIGGSAPVGLTKANANGIIFVRSNHDGVS